MPCLGMHNNRCYIFTKDKLRVIFSVKEKIELMFGMSGGYSFQTLIGKPSNAFQPVF